MIGQHRHDQVWLCTPPLLLLFSSTSPPPPDCFYFLRISISSFIYLFVINLNDPATEAGLAARQRMTRHGLGPIAEGAAG